MTGPALRRIFQFGVFEADEASGELRKHGLRVKLHSQAFQVLVMLLEQPAQVVTREEMRERLWGSETFVDFDHGLNSAISKIRTALNDSSSQPRYVETIAGKGYRFIAPVSQAATSAEGATAPLATEVPTVPLLSKPEELPVVPRKAVVTLLVMVQALYLGLYLTALANLREAADTLIELGLAPERVAITVLTATAAMLIPVRLYLIAAVCLGLKQLPLKFARMFPVLLILDVLWALSPFLLIHHVSLGFALGMTAILVYLPFAQRSLVLMYGGN